MHEKKNLNGVTVGFIKVYKHLYISVNDNSSILIRRIADGIRGVYVCSGIDVGRGQDSYRTGHGCTHSDQFGAYGNLHRGSGWGYIFHCGW